MAIILLGIDVGPAGSKMSSIGALDAATTTIRDRVPLDYSPAVNRLLTAGSTKAGVTANVARQSVAPRGMAARMKKRFYGHKAGR
jgi:hypothetical protein